MKNRCLQEIYANWESHKVVTIGRYSSPRYFCYFYQSWEQNMRLNQILKSTAVAVCSTLAFSAVHAADITGGGSSFVYPAYSKWADSYKAATGNNVNYQSIGSGAGIKQIEAKTVDFG